MRYLDELVSCFTHRQCGLKGSFSLHSCYIPCAVSHKCIRCTPTLCRTTVSVARRTSFIPPVRHFSCFSCTPAVWSFTAGEKSGPSSIIFPDEFLEELRRHISAFPESEWVRVSDLYGRLSSEAKRQYVRPYKTLSAVLSHVQNRLDVSLHEGGVYWCRGSRAEWDPRKAVDVPAETEGGDDEGSKVDHDAKETEFIVLQDSESTGRTLLSPVRVTSAPVMNPFSPALSSASVECHPVDFFYDVGLTEIPPPPNDFHVTPSSLGGVRPTEDGSVISLKSFVSYIPSYFVPLTEVLEKMPGYTEQHIESYFKSPAVEMVNILGRRFIRLYGGYGKIGLEGTEGSEQLFPSYKPDVALAEPFVKAFEGIADKWMPLTVLLSRAGSEAAERLPFKGPEAIIYFAQMQHLFAFAVDAKNGGAVLLRPPGYGGLEAHTTPTPKIINFLVRFMPLEGTCDVAHVEAAASHLMDEIKLFYGSLIRCLEMHAPIFYLEPGHSIVMLTNYKRRLHVATLPLEEQLSVAMQKRDKHKVRSLRRRIAFRDNPSHSFHDPDNLAREVARHLPRKGFVTLKQFMKRSISEELLFFMPRKTHNFFTKYPQYFTIFEFQYPGAWCISRPEEPLPKGVIRQEFSDNDIIRLIAQYLQQKGPKSCTQILVNLPRGATESIKKRHGGMYYLVTKSPEYFSVIIGSESRNALHSAVVHLLKIPGPELASPVQSPSASPAASDSELDDEDTDD